MILQARYDLQVTEAKLGERISTEVRPLQKAAPTVLRRPSFQAEIGD
jgi:hypothetical protein